MNGYHIQLIQPGLVEIHEETGTYRMTRAEIEEAIANVKARRPRYASELAYQRRLSFFEDMLKAMEPKEA